MCSLLPASSICFENPLAVIAEEARGQYLRVVWKRAPWHLSAAQTVMEQLLVCLRRTGWGKILVKQPPMPAFPVSYHTWLLYNWLPRAQAAGAWCFALIPPRDLFAHVGYADFLSQLRQRGVHYTVADSREQAIAWLQQQTPTG
ncbi:hypothetical protein [Hymenobacter fodinae]|uniref:STAS/SEC14 domain-containing protein n=1 Tax=Hymenobacter fodinae TaxID=2510796 RepID=A0A4Z0P2B3_9BACT|nr:hypothetical protein [Hymenobacter fodinae]TGE04115.1 hypothetical protein EU556_22865 [Hymenobacter fodinae]